MKISLYIFLFPFLTSCVVFTNHEKNENGEFQYSYCKYEEGVKGEIKVVNTDHELNSDSTYITFDFDNNSESKYKNILFHNLVDSFNIVKSDTNIRLSKFLIPSNSYSVKIFSIGQDVLYLPELKLENTKSIFLKVDFGLPSAYVTYGLTSVKKLSTRKVRRRFTD